MCKKLWNWAKKHEEILLYLIFGFLTTVVNYLVYFPLYNATTLLASLANVIAWCAAVVFAYLTNKPFVFKSYDWSIKTVLPESIKFVTARIASLLIETAIIYITVDLLTWNGNYMKIITSVLVVIINYIASKVIVFRKRIDA